MENAENLDLLIKEYSGQLMKAYSKRSPLLKEETVPVVAYTPERQPETAAETAETPPPTATETIPSDTDASLSGRATFYASVRSGGGAFPVPSAKVLIKKDGEIFSFLVTDENGNTATVSLPAYPEKDSLSSETAREVQYFSDVYAEGFQEKLNLPVAASGGAEIVLNVELTPNEERME